jgi:hypothetical protein
MSWHRTIFIANLNSVGRIDSAAIIGSSL